MLHGSPWYGMHFHCHQMITQAWPKVAQHSLEVTRKSQLFEPIQVLPGRAA